MGRGSSKAGGGGGGKTPSGVTYQQFMQMTDDQKYDTINSILGNQNIQVPNTLDNSDTTKVIYALGMKQRPTVVSDSQLDTLPGREIYRTVYESGSMPPPTTDAVLDEIRNRDYTHMSGSGGSAHGRAIYFATSFTDSADYGRGEQNPMVMRAKINPGAKILRESNLTSQMQNDTNFGSRVTNLSSSRDSKALWALSHGIDGWYSNTYTMIVNRGALTASSQNKSINGSSWAGSANK